MLETNCRRNLAQGYICTTGAEINIGKAQESVVYLLKLLCVLQGCNLAPDNGLQQNLFVPTIVSQAKA